MSQRPLSYPSKTPLLLSIALSLLASSGVAQPQRPAPQPRRPDPSRPYEAEQHALVTASARRGAEGTLALLELWRNWDEVSPQLSLPALAELSANRRLPVERRAYAAALYARGLIRTGEVELAASVIDQQGYVQDWNVVGPFDNEGKRGFDRVFQPEEERRQPFEFGSTYAGKERDVRWRHYESGFLGYTNFDALFRPYENVCAYASTTVTLERAQSLALWVGGGGATRVWWNGEPVFEDAGYRAPDPDRAVVAVVGATGDNRLLVKSCVTEGQWGFFARLTDTRGRPFEVNSSRDSSAEVPQAPTSQPRLRWSAPLAQLEAAAERGTGAALYNLARFLLYTGADDPAVERVRQLAARAAEVEPSVAHLELALRTAASRADMNRHAQAAERLAPNDASVWLLQAQLAQTSLYPESAIPFLDRIDARAELDVVGLQAKLLRASLLRDMDLPMAARRLVEEVAILAPGAPGFLRARAEAAVAAGARDEAITLYRAAVAARWDDRGSRRVLVADAVRRSSRARAESHLEAIALIASDDQRNLRYVASLYEALSDNEEALTTLNRARRLAPEDSTTIVAHGELLLRLGQSDAAIADFQMALELRPQDAATRELLEQVQPQERQDEAYAATAEEFLERRGEHAGYPSTTLQDLTVNTVFDNGLGSSFRQIAVQLHNEEAARDFRTYSIQFDPDSQRLDVRLARVHRANGEVLEATQSFEQQMGEPWYRIYYDTRARVLVFSDLQPGDTVELRWRIDDIAHRNLFADYYGDVRFFRSHAPSKHQEYVLITPEEREFYFNEPAMTGLSHERSIEDGTRIDRFVAENIPAINSEPNMPGMTEVAPYLHVSTYRTWQDVGRWYWGLIQDQLNLDDALRTTVRNLIRGKTADRDKVIAIHDWVVANTRYVGLEFGIHGYQPYRVTQIVQRGFGDCKDKASLMFAMFREAGVDAHIVLTRTRRNGRIDDLPASLAVFDHAIAYVPSLDLYIDGTAEHNGITELPDMDQGVSVLHVWPEGSELRRTPVLSPAQNHRVRNLTVRLALDGSARLEAEEIVTGGQAPGYRARYQAEGTQRTRLERSLRGLFPGLSLDRHTFEGLDTLEGNIRYTYRGDVPRFAAEDQGTLRVAPTALEELTRSLARQASREHTLDLGSPAAYEEIRSILLPAGVHVTELPAGGTAESPFGRLSIVATQTARAVVIHTEFETRQDTVSPADYPAFRAWVEAADQILRQQLTVSP